jgi:hypothetical protein
MTIGKYLIYIVIVSVLLIAYYHRESIVDRISQKVKGAKMPSHITDDQVADTIKHARSK